MTRLLTAVLSLLLSTQMLAADFTEGQDYKKLNITPIGGSTVNVTEFFSYGCPWCFRLEPELQKWRKRSGKHVKFERIPAVFNQNWVFNAKGFYIAKAFGMQDKLSPKLFAALKEDSAALSSDEKLIAFFAAAGVDEVKVKSALEDSVVLEANIAHSKAKLAEYKIFAVPAIVVDGQYVVNSQMAKGDFVKLFETVDYLVKKVLADRQSITKD